LIVLKCHQCARELSGAAPTHPVRLWGIFRMPARGLVVEPVGAVSKRCRHCGWINVFDRTGEAALSPSWRDMELKGSFKGGDTAA
jgi:hypothetical protein